MQLLAKEGEMSGEQDHDRKRRPKPQAYAGRGFEEAPAAGFGMAPQSLEPGAPPRPSRTRLVLGPGGRVVIPAALRDAMQVKEGDAMLAWVEGQELHLMTALAAMRAARERVMAALPQPAGLVDELLAERRAEALRESGNA
jgi:bifunctional DNA-binding transcriptional regulator/antitoxin component of YhaV-PrlF toxin-antitoxin module